MGLSNGPGSVESTEIQEFEKEFRALFAAYQPHYPKINYNKPCLRGVYDGRNEFSAMVSHATNFFRSHLKNRPDAEQLEAVIRNVLSEFYAEVRNGQEAMADDLFYAELMKEIYKGMAIGRNEKDKARGNNGELDEVKASQRERAASGFEYLLTENKSEDWGDILKNPDLLTKKEGWE